MKLMTSRLPTVIRFRLNGQLLGEHVPNPPLTSSDSPADAEDGDSDDEPITSKSDNLLDQVDRLLDLPDSDMAASRSEHDGSEMDTDDAPEWFFEGEEKVSQDPDYIFCPAVHRKQLLHIFTYHYC